MAQRRMIDDWADEEFLLAKLCVTQRSYNRWDDEQKLRKQALIDAMYRRL
jgi:hypothetical protein